MTVNKSLGCQKSWPIAVVRKQVAESRSPDVVAKSCQDNGRAAMHL